MLAMDRGANNILDELKPIYDESKIIAFVGFLGSPTIRVDGIDVEPNMTFGKNDFSLRLRSYEKDGQQSAILNREMIEETVEVGHLAELNMLGKCC